MSIVAATVSTPAIAGGPTGVEYLINVPQHMLDRWAAEVAALAPRKVKNWKGSSYDNTGRKVAVRYSQEGVLTAHGLVHFVAKTDGKEKRVMDKEGAEVKGWVAVVSQESVARLMQHPDYIIDAVNHRIAQSFVDGTINEVRQAMAAEARTGNHCPRNHPIAVPTRAGEPVRG